MPRWLTRTCRRIRALALAGEVRFTEKASAELRALDLHLNRQDAIGILATFRFDDLDARIRSDTFGEWLYVFRPSVAGVRLYIKVALRAGCVVVSFHDEREDDQGIS